MFIFLKSPGEVCTLCYTAGGTTHHVHDLLERQPELEGYGLGLVDDGTLQLLVVRHQVVE